MHPVSTNLIILFITGAAALSSVQSLAVDISLAALLGEDVYNFGELLLHPIVSVAFYIIGLLAFRM